MINCNIVNFNKYEMPMGLLYETYKTHPLNNCDDEYNVINEDIYNKLLNIISLKRSNKNKTLKYKRKHDVFNNH